MPRRDIRVYIYIYRYLCYNRRAHTRTHDTRACKQHFVWCATGGEGGTTLRLLLFGGEIWFLFDFIYDRFRRGSVDRFCRPFRTK